MKVAAMVLAITLALGVAPAQPQDKPEGPVIGNGSKVRIEYTLKDKEGEVLDSNKGRNALTYTHGERQIIPGLEDALIGMRDGEEKSVTVKPEDAYGMEDPAAMTEVPKESIPADALKVGTRLVGRSQSGETRFVRVKEIKEKTVILDLNHPLAGKTLHFDVKVLGVEPSEK
jgi:FKBP-type peptidyl-prolyl cis-trans isomerase SlyD